MVDNGPYPGDGESRAPRKHRSEQRSSRPNTHDTPNGYTGERNPNRSHHECSQNRPRERDEHHGERRQNRPREDRSRDHHQERERYHGDQNRSRDRHYDGGGHSRYEADRSRSRYEDRDGYYIERSPSGYEERSHHHRERSRNRLEERERHPESYVQSVDQHGLSMNKKEPERYYSSERSFSPHGPEFHDLEYYEAEREGGILDCHKCRYLCTGRACCQLVEVLLNMLILICCSVSYSSTGGFTGITNMGGIYYYQFGGAYSGFSGADGEKAQQLDVQFYNLKLPTVTASMAFGGALMAFSCLMVLLGVLRVPWRWPVCLLVECGLDIAIAVGYVPALYFYFKRLLDAYNTQVCKDREALYTSKGYQGFTCALHGADIAAALFACMAIIAFFMSAFLAVKGFRTIRLQKKKPINTIEF
ncbi:MARVEL domain-containing protein 3 isoform 1-T1 [Anomaloglossus baeobatrachus]|uniref:MARVEL domain-containing protein 3 isoform X1 n=1 Tax=Anomaloglossus baeobatrachus TaxID=238106 RepID=UPI003F4F6BE7